MYLVSQVVEPYLFEFSAVTMLFAVNFNLELASPIIFGIWVCKQKKVLVKWAKQLASPTKSRPRE